MFVTRCNATLFFLFNKNSPSPPKQCKTQFLLNPPPLPTKKTKRKKEGIEQKETNMHKTTSTAPPESKYVEENPNDPVAEVDDAILSLFKIENPNAGQPAKPSGMPYRCDSVFPERTQLVKMIRHWRTLRETSPGVALIGQLRNPKTTREWVSAQIAKTAKCKKKNKKRKSKVAKTPKQPGEAPAQEQQCAEDSTVDHHMNKLTSESVWRNVGDFVVARKDPDGKSRIRAARDLTEGELVFSEIQPLAQVMNVVSEDKKVHEEAMEKFDPYIKLMLDSDINASFAALLAMELIRKGFTSEQLRELGYTAPAEVGSRSLDSESQNTINMVKAFLRQKRNEQDTGEPAVPLYEIRVNKEGSDSKIPDDQAPPCSKEAEANLAESSLQHDQTQKKPDHEQKSNDRAKSHTSNKPKVVRKKKRRQKKKKHPKKVIDKKKNKKKQREDKQEEQDEFAWIDDPSLLEQAPFAPHHQDELSENAIFADEEKEAKAILGWIATNAMAARVPVFPECINGIVISRFALMARRGCDPNVRLVVGTRGETRFYTSRPVKTGEEFEMHWDIGLGLTAPFKTRTSLIKETYGFECDCRRCKQDQAAETRKNGANQGAVSANIGNSLPDKTPQNTAALDRYLIVPNTSAEWRETGIRRDCGDFIRFQEQCLTSVLEQSVDSPSTMLKSSLDDCMWFISDARVPTCVIGFLIRLWCKLIVLADANDHKKWIFRKIDTHTLERARKSLVHWRNTGKTTQLPPWMPFEPADEVFDGVKESKYYQMLDLAIRQRLIPAMNKAASCNRKRLIEPLGLVAQVGVVELLIMRMKLVENYSLLQEHKKLQKEPSEEPDTFERALVEYDARFKMSLANFATRLFNGITGVECLIRSAGFAPNVAWLKRMLDSVVNHTQQQLLPEDTLPKKEKS